MIKPLPSEAYECKRFVEWLRSENIAHTHVANATNSPRQGLINKALGTSKGFPDYIILLPNKALFVEMKRHRSARSQTSPAQKRWHARLTELGFSVKVCHGYEEAREFVIAQRSGGRPSDSGD